MKKCFIVSSNFSPGHFSHMLAYYKLMEEIGYETYLYCDEKYILFFKDEIGDIRVINIKNKKNKIYPDVIIIQNPSIKNTNLVRFFNKNCKKIYIYHEPWDGIKEKLKEGKKQFIKFSLIKFFQTRLLKKVDLVLLPSNKAIKNYENYEASYNNSYKHLPLLFDDELNEKVKFEIKEYFSFIGGATKSRAFSKFIKFIKYANKENKDLKFQIVTRINIQQFLDEELKLMIKEGNLIIQHGKTLLNEEINLAYKRSYAVWNLYNRSTQSGVLTKALMFGTSSICTAIGSFEEVIEDNYNGIILVNNENNFEILNAVKKIKRKKEFFATNSRAFFMERNFYRSNIKVAKKIIDNIKEGK